MRGQVVVCKDVIGDALIRTVWEDKDGLVFIHTEDQYEARLRGRPHLEAVGFPLEDVFVHTSHASHALDEETCWDKLRPYQQKEAPSSGASLSCHGKSEVITVSVSRV
jgi:hypothetical protein